MRHQSFDKANRARLHRTTALDAVFRMADTQTDLGSIYDAMRSNLQAVSPRIAARSASLKLGVPRM
jgi:hypothetical protein